MRKGQIVPYKIDHNMPLGRLFDDACARFGLLSSQVGFLIDPNDSIIPMDVESYRALTPRFFELEDNDVIDVLDLHVDPHG